MHHKLATILLIPIALLVGTALRGAETIFLPVKVDGPVHDPSQNSYWYGPFCECALRAD